MAKEAYAQAHVADSNAQDARAAADAADAAADDAEAAAASARSEADAATQAAADADAAATRAEAAAKRARADADDAKAAKLKADAAVKKSTSAAADAIKASEDAATAAREADALADEAEQHAQDARSDADDAKYQATTAVAASADAAGHAYTTAQAAEDAKNAAAQVAAPANDAIQLGSPYIDTDNAAGLAVLTGQASKTIAEQQQAVAEAHAQNAKEEAERASSLADTATGDAKAAYVLAAEAAGHAYDARVSAKDAMASAAAAAQAAADASDSLAQTIEYDQQATKDANAADAAAKNAEGYAQDARASADEAALDASAARQAAAEAEQAAQNARAAADRAAEDAAAAEKAAEEAQAAAESAQDAAELAEQKQANQAVATGAGTGIGGTFYVVDKISPVGEPHQDNDCVLGIGLKGCTVQFTVHFTATVSFYLCTDPTVPATETGCPDHATVFLGTQTYKDLSHKVTRYFSKLEIGEGITKIIAKVAWKMLTQDFVDCWHGSVSGCAWAASNFIPGKKIEDAVMAIRALDAAMHTGVGVSDAFRALKALDLNAASMAKIEQTVNLYEDVLTSCKFNSFPGGTQVLMANGTRKAISEIGRGDLLLAGNPANGHPEAEPVTATYQHDTRHLMEIEFSGGTLTSTPGHRYFVVGRGWITAAHLHVGDLLVTSDGAKQPVSALHGLPVTSPREVYDLTVDGLHTFFVAGRGSDSENVLVHNCANILADEGVSGAHTLEEHVDLTDAQAYERAQTKGKVTKWNDGATAARAVDEALRQWEMQGNNAKVLADWKIKQAQKRGKGIGFDPRRDLLSIRWTLKGEGSLGRMWVKGGSREGEAVDNVVLIQLKYVKDHKPKKWVVYTAYPARGA
jgi:hypothetical protein